MKNLSSKTMAELNAERKNLPNIKNKTYTMKSESVVSKIIIKPKNVGEVNASTVSNADRIHTNTTTQILTTEIDGPTGGEEQDNILNRMTGGEIVVISKNYKYFNALSVLTNIVGVLMLIAMLCWINIYQNGLGNDFRFEWHPMLMTFGYIFLYGNAILVYRYFRKSKKRNLKIAHGVLLGIVMIIIPFALVPAFQADKISLYSLHAWLGLTAVIVFILQFLSGFMTFALPLIKDVYKISYMPTHIFFGVFAFVLGLMAALTGIAEQVQHKLGDDYSKLKEPALLANFCGGFIILFGALVSFLVSFPLYKRVPLTLDYFAGLVNNYLEDKFK